MTGAELIDLLQSHPKACKALGIHPSRNFAGTTFVRTYDGSVFWSDDTEERTVRFRRWLLGSLVEHFILQGWWLPERSFSVTMGLEHWRAECHPNVHPTIFHALLAGMEANHP